MMKSRWPRDKVRFTIKSGDEARLVSASFTLESAYGSVKPSRKPEDFDEISRNVKEAKAEETTRELSGACASSVRDHIQVPDQG